MNINKKTWQFIREHAEEDVRRVALKGEKDAEVDLTMALQQIAGRQTARRKLPSWAAVEGIVYPPHLNMEQCSSEQTARYKAGLVEDDRLWTTGDDMSFVDLTGGFGVDFYWMAKAIASRPSPAIRHLTYIERNEALCAISTHNFRLLGLDCSVCCCDMITYLTNMPHVNLIYLDPARRNEHGGRTYGIEDCSPNVLELLPILMSKADRVMLKLSPMLDWRKAVEDLQRASSIVQEIHIVSVANECKELLVVLSKEQTDGLRVVCVNGASSFDFFPNLGINFSQFGNKTFPTWEYSASLKLADSPLYLYEPNASIMKAGCFTELETRFAVQQIAPNSHLFLSPDEIGNFPGRRFQILAISSMNKQELSTALKKTERANVSVRNFPLSADKLRKKLKLKDGGDTFLFATTMANGAHQLFICRKIG
jgi:hypothetical protein